jgi:aminopeptidase N
MITVFNQTALMPTYLFAFVISDFDMKSSTSANNILFRAFSRPEQIRNTEFGLETAEKALKLFEDSFQRAYELEKLDQVALPVFNAGGMENYGIVFYREDYFLFEPSVSFSDTERAFRGSWV